MALGDLISWTGSCNDIPSQHGMVGQHRADSDTTGNVVSLSAQRWPAFFVLAGHVVLKLSIERTYFSSTSEAMLVWTVVVLIIISSSASCQIWLSILATFDTVLMCSLYRTEDRDMSGDFTCTRNLPEVQDGNNVIITWKVGRKPTKQRVIRLISRSFREFSTHLKPTNNYGRSGHTHTHTHTHTL